MRYRRHLTSLLLALVAGTLPACHVVAPEATRQVQAQPLLTGQIVPDDRRVAALLSDIANGATVSLIDGSTGQTVCTAVSSPTGAFSLYTTVAFTPVVGRPYYVEAAKGLPMGGEANRAGASVARLRTILFYQGGSWLSLGSAVPGSSLTIGWATTATAVIASLRNLAAADQLALAGHVTGQAFNATGTLIDPTEFNAVYSLVDAALRADQDPLEVIQYDPAASPIAARYGRVAGPLVINDAVSPATAVQGGTVTLTGQNFPVPRSDTTVSVGDLPVAGWTVNAPRTQLTVTLGSNAYGGILKIAQGASTWYGPYVPVRGTVGTLVGNGKLGFLDGQGTAAMFQDPIGIAADAFGNLYASSGQRARIAKITPAGLMTTFAGLTATGSVNGDATVATFYAPHGMAVDSVNNVYLADYANHLVRRITPGAVTSTVAGSTVGFANGPAASAQFYYDTGVCVARDGTVFVAEQGNDVIRKITPAGVVSTYAGIPGSPGNTNGDARTAQFGDPAGVALDSSGNLYVADESTNAIRKINSTGTTVSTLNTTPLAANPFGLTVDAAGNVYVACRYANVIQKVAPDGTVTTLAGSGAQGFQDGATSSAQFSWPHGLALVGNNLYVTDRSSHRIRVITF